MNKKVFDGWILNFKVKLSFFLIMLKLSMIIQMLRVKILGPSVILFALEYWYFISMFHVCYELPSIIFFNIIFLVRKTLLSSNIRNYFYNKISKVNLCSYYHLRNCYCWHYFVVVFPSYIYNLYTIIFIVIRTSTTTLSWACLQDYHDNTTISIIVIKIFVHIFTFVRIIVLVF